MMLELQDLLNEANKNRTSLTRIKLNETQQKGANNIVETIKSGGIALGIGPPGTGKTVAFNIAQSDVFEKIDEKEVLVYVAPTNRLVEECAVRTLAFLLSKGYNENDLKSFIRVYGSRFKPEHLKEDAKIVFTTPYQPGALKSLSKIKSHVHIMVDEASTTPLHGPFIETAMAMAEIIRKRERLLGWIYSFSVIGDPMQAITERYTLRDKFELLIVGRLLLEIIPEDERSYALQNPPALFELAEKYHPSFGIGYFFLKYTYRIPEPTELIVSVPFYNRILKGVESYEKRLKNIKEKTPSVISWVLQNCSFLRDKNDIVDVIDNSLDSQIPIVYLKDKGPAYIYKKGRSLLEMEELDIKRAEVASEVAAYLAALTADNVTIDVLTPYVEMKTQIQMRLKALVGSREELKRRIRVSTIHSALGSEADIIVAVLGKEYKGKEEDKMTIYFQTPELINVQFSRHRRMLVIIGNIEKLANAFEKTRTPYVSLLTKALNELKERELISEVKFS
jgi:hypothetical protein